MGRMDKTMCIVQEKMYRYIPLNYTAYHLQVAQFSSARYAMHSLILKNCASSRLRSSVQSSMYGISTSAYSPFCRRYTLFTICVLL